MAKRERPTDDRLREFATEHLDYEVGMVAGLVERFREIRTAIDAAGDGEPKIPDLVTRNAQVESFVMHARVLLEFLYSDRPKRRDDAVAADYFDEPETWKGLRPSKTAELERLPGRVGKGVVHLTYARLDADKTWLIDLCRDLAAVVYAFAENASSERLPPDVRARILGYVPTPTADPAPALGVTTTASLATTSIYPLPPE